MTYEKISKKKRIIIYKENYKLTASKKSFNASASEDCC